VGGDERGGGFSPLPRRSSCRQGYEVVGITLKTHRYEDVGGKESGGNQLLLARRDQRRAGCGLASGFPTTSWTSADGSSRR